MCDRTTSLTDPTADFVLSDLLTATEDLIDFSINAFDTIRLQMHFNDRNRRICLGMQLRDASNEQKTEFGFVKSRAKACTVTTTLKYDLALYLDRILQACKRTKANLMLLRVSRIRSTNATLLLVASTNVRVEQLNKKVQLLTRLVKENGGEFQIRKKKKKNNLLKRNANENNESKQESFEQKRQSKSLNLMSQEDLSDYVEIVLSFRIIITKYREFIQHVRRVTQSNGQTSIGNSIVLVPIAANAINELNNILNRLMRIAFTIEIESNYLRQPPMISMPIDDKDLDRKDDEDISTNNVAVHNPMLSMKRIDSLQMKVSQSIENKITSPKENFSSQYSYLKQHPLKQNEIRNHSAIPSSITTIASSDINSFKLTSNMIVNLFEDILDKNESLV